MPIFTSSPNAAPRTPVGATDNMPLTQRGPAAGRGGNRPAPPFAVAFCENGAGYGGAVISLEAMLANLPPEFTAHIYTGLDVDPYPQLARLGRWRRVRALKLLKMTWLRRTGLPGISMLDNVANMLPTALSYYWRFKRDGVRLVYLNNDASCNMAAALGARLARLPIVLHARGFNADTAGNRWVLAQLHHAMPVSSAVRDELLGLGLKPERSTVVPEGLDLTAFAPRPASPALRAELGIGHDEPVVTLVGGLVDWKGQDVLLEAAPRILQHHPRAHLLLVGEAYGRDRSFADAIAAGARAPALNGRVRLLGMRRDIPEILALSSVVLHASTTPEPFGRTFLEGMALGRPVIASGEGGPLDVITDRVDGLLIPPRDPARLAEAVLRLLDDPAYASALGERAAATAFNYSIERHTDLVCAVLHRVLDGAHN
jgi:glycosyltransferase involved in cell wall biosynthesis